MDHPNILKLYEIFRYECNPNAGRGAEFGHYRYYVVTELCNGGELFEEIVKRKFFSEKDAS